ncbi:MAG: replicative DNA helicase [Chloroflexi bacterium CG07_land_8_20_14_0_80_45_17]|nr:MAG: replicative DNA helicase [Chloroflexi bacterium CG07_land_8_20_14_0_80_45_17]
MAQEKLPPHDIEAEEAVIGSLLIDPEAILKVATFLKPEDFFDETNQAIYQACLSLYQRNEVINQITVAHELMRQNKLEQIGGAAYLSHLISIVPTSLHVEHYAQIVSEMGVMRHLITAAGQIAAIGYEAGPDIEASLNKAEDILFQVKRGRDTRDFVSMREALGQYFEEAGKPTVSWERELPHVLTGFAGLDDLLGGLQPSDLIVLAARPSLGKTSLALNIARNTAINQGACVALFSLEMARESVVQRLLASESGVNSRDVRLGRFGENDEARIIEASGILSEAAIYIDDSPQLRVIDIRSKARRLHFERNIDLIIVDYLQLIQGDGRNETRVQEISKITRSLKTLARELDVPVLAVSQLSRAVEWRASHVPQLADLRESGTIEQDADIVVFIYRDDMYHSEEEWYKLHDIEKERYPRGIADIIVAKHRNGPLGRVKLRFLNRVVKFDNLEEAESISTP